jgi:hypothetical protein
MLLLKQAAEASYLEAEELSTLRQAVQDKKFLFVAETIKKKMGSKSHAGLRAVALGNGLNANFGFEDGLASCLFWLTLLQDCAIEGV